MKSALTSATSNGTRASDSRAHKKGGPKRENATPAMTSKNAKKNAVITFKAEPHGAEKVVVLPSFIAGTSTWGGRREGRHRRLEGFDDFGARHKNEEQNGISQGHHQAEDEANRHHGLHDAGSGGRDFSLGGKRLHEMEGEE